MRFIRLLVLALIAIALITVSIANRGALTIKLLPDELAQLLGFRWDITLPAFVILLGAVLIGVLLGFVWEWVRERKFRVEANVQRKERERLEREVKIVAPTTESGDYVLSLLEGT